MKEKMSVEGAATICISMLIVAVIALSIMLSVERNKRIELGKAKQSLEQRAMEQDSLVNSLCLQLEEMTIRIGVDND